MMEDKAQSGQGECSITGLTFTDKIMEAVFLGHGSHLDEVMTEDADNY